jgi:hypothetical protein
MYFIHKRIMFVEMYTIMMLECSLYLAGGFVSGMTGSLAVQWIVHYISEPLVYKTLSSPKNISHSYCSYR